MDNLCDQDQFAVRALVCVSLSGDRYSACTRDMLSMLVHGVQEVLGRQSIMSSVSITTTHLVLGLLFGISKYCVYISINLKTLHGWSVMSLHVCSSYLVLYGAILVSWLTAVEGTLCPSVIVLLLQLD